MEPTNARVLLFRGGISNFAEEMNSRRDIYAIIVAGGSGQRFGAATPKQFLPLGGRPVLMHTIERFAAIATVVLVLPQPLIGLWEEQCREHSFDADVRVVAGGESRFHSVANALAAIGDASDDAIVLVHDGVRPLVSRRLIDEAIAAAVRFAAVVPVVPLSDSIRRIDGDRTVAVERERYVAVQTPQAFRLDLLRTAYAVGFRPQFTDDASVVEAAGHPVATFPGEPTNIKITYPRDLIIAEALLPKL